MSDRDKNDLAIMIAFPLKLRGIDVPKDVFDYWVSLAQFIRDGK